MAEFDRRSFLGTSFGIAAGATMPEWLARAFAIQDPVSTWRLQQLRAAIERARKAEKPLLVLVVPAQNDQDVRGKWFGALLGSWDFDVQWLLVCSEIACATTAELGKVGGIEVQGAPLFVFADVAGNGAGLAKVTPVDCVLPELAKAPTSDRSTASISRRDGLRVMRPALTDGAVRHGVSLDALAESAAKRLDAAQRVAIDAWFAGATAKPPSLELVAAAAAEFWRRINARPEWPGGHIRALRKTVYAQLCDQPMAGARWKSWYRCAPEFVSPTQAEAAAEAKAEAAAKSERETAMAKAREEVQSGKLTQDEYDARFAFRMFSCGMGYVGDVSMQFLEFWTAGD